MSDFCYICGGYIQEKHKTTMWATPDTKVYVHAECKRREKKKNED